MGDRNPPTDAQRIADLREEITSLRAELEERNRVRDSGEAGVEDRIDSLRAELKAARACIRDALHLTPVVPDEDHWSWRHLEVVKAAREEQ